MAIPILLFLGALLARAATAVLFSDPAYPDSFYYTTLARELASGSGFEIDFIWNFVEVGGRLPAEGVLPIPANAHWMPLAAVVQVPFIWLLGPTTLAAGLPFWIAAAAVAPLTYFIGLDAGMPRWQATAAGLLIIAPAIVAPYLSQPDNFALFMFLGASALWCCARGLRGDRRAFALGGIVVGLAILSRNDGLLLALPYGLAVAYDVLRPPRGSRIGWWPVAAFAVGFLILVTPWLLRQLDVFGSISPSSASGRILFITEYRELYSVTTETTLQSFLGQGLGQLLWTRLGGLGSAIFIFSVMPLVIILVPFLLVGLWLKRRDPDYLPWLIYGLALFAFTALVSALHAPYGTFLHSAVALMPHAYLLSLVGIAWVVRAVAARRPSWDAPRATRNFSFMAVAVIALVSALATVMNTGEWKRVRDGRTDVLAVLASAAQPDDLVMSPDAGAYHYLGGWSGIVTPDDPLPVVEDALRLYGVRWLALERDHITEGLYPLLAGEVRPAWLSDPLLEVPPPPDVKENPELPRAALYAVCLAPEDHRCSA